MGRKTGTGFCGLVSVVGALCLPAAPSSAPRRQQGGFYLTVPFRRQVGFLCGPASLAMVLEYWGRASDHRYSVESPSLSRAEGLTGAELRDAARRHGFLAESLQADSEFVRHQLKAGRPLILLLGNGSPNRPGHFVVVVGWDPSANNWLIHDPSKGPYQRVDDRILQERWNVAERWTLLVVPRNPG